MIDAVLNLLYGCRHRRITRPITPVKRMGWGGGDTYVVCLDCGKQFRYDLVEMRIAEPLSEPVAPVCTARFQAQQ